MSVTKKMTPSAGVMATPEVLPAYLAIAQTLEAQILDGTYPIGSTLPAQRDLAISMGVNVSTVSRAYRELQARGMVAGRKRLGTVVMRQPSHRPISERHLTSEVDLTYNCPPTSDFFLRYGATLKKIADDSRFAEVQRYSSTAGPIWARETGAQWLGHSGLNTAADQVVITSGAQHGLFTALCTFIKPGDIVLSDRLTYFGLRALAATLQFRIMCVDSDDEGLIPGHVDACCRSEKIAAIFVVPTFHNPTVKTMSEARRAEIASLSQKHDLMVLEDDVYSLLPHERLRPIALRCPERTFYITAMSKALAPSLCLGYLVAPSEYTNIAAESTGFSGSMPSPTSALVMTQWIENGTAMEILDANRREIEARQLLVSEIFDGLRYRSASTSMFAWLTLPEGWLASDFTRSARHRGIRVLPSSSFAVDEKGVEQGVRINLASTSSREALAASLRVLRKLHDDRPRVVSGSI